MLTFIYLAIQIRPVQHYIAQKLTVYASSKINTRLHIGGIDVALFSRVILKDVWIEDQKSDTLAYAERISATISSVKFRKKKIELSRLSLDQLKLNIHKDSAGIYNFNFLARPPDEDSPRSEFDWEIDCNRFILRNSALGLTQTGETPRNIEIDEIRTRIDQFRMVADTMQFRLFSMSLNDQKGFYLNEMSANVSLTGRDLRIEHLRLETLQSNIENTHIALLQKNLPGSDDWVSEIDVTIGASSLSLADIALFVPDISGMDQQIELSGHISGNMRNLRAREINITTGENTRLLADFSVSLLPGFSEPFLFVELKQSQTDFRDLARIKLPDRSATKQLRFPPGFYQAGIITYQGNFTGFMSDFVAYGTINSRMGRLKTDLSFIPEGNNSIRYRGRLETAGFNLGRLWQNDLLGEISFAGLVNGLFNRNTQLIDGAFDGSISRWLVKGYPYSDIEVNGQLSNKKFDGNITFDDPNLKMDFAGQLDLNQPIPVFDFSLDLHEANLAALRIDSVNTRSELKFGLVANFSGTNVDNLDGRIQFNNGSYANQNSELNFNNLLIHTHVDASASQLTIESDFIDLTVAGEYSFNSLFESFRTIAATYLPAYRRIGGTLGQNNRFSLLLRAKNLNEVTAVFAPELKIGTPFAIEGKIDAPNSEVFLQGVIPDISWKDFSAREVDLTIKPDNRTLDGRIRIQTLSFQDEYVLYNPTLLLNAGGNTLHSRLVWGNLDDISYAGEIGTRLMFTSRTGGMQPLIRGEILPSRIIIADSLWQMHPSAFSIDTTAIHINRFAISSGLQNIGIDGIISEDLRDQLSIQFEALNLGTLNHYLQKSTGIEGVLDGSLAFFDFYRSRMFYSDLSLNGFVFRAETIGDVSLVNKWDRSSGKIDSRLLVTQDKESRLDIDGTFDPLTREVIYQARLNKMPIHLLGTVIPDTFSGWKGEGTGTIAITGQTEKILLNGAIMAENAGLTINYTQVAYQLSDSIRFANDRIIFRNIRMTDQLGNPGTLNGNIRHDNFNNMDFNLTISSGQILALNTNSRHDDRFFGRALARGTFRVLGNISNVRLVGEATTLAGTSLTIVLGEDEEVTRYDFVRFLAPEWHTTGTAVAETASTAGGGADFDLTITVTPEARAQIIYNTQITDVIRAQGEGVLRFRMDRSYNIDLSGNFNVTQGEYLFTLQNVINKRFTIEPGGSIVWTGNPYNAVIDLSAVYRLKASLRELFTGTLRPIDYTQRIPVECKILLTEDLLSPAINFDIVFPTVEDRLRDEMQQHFSTQEELNKQMLSLLVLGQFYTPEYMRGTYEAGNPNLIGNTASDLFSNQLSNWLSQINRNVDIGINYRPGNQLTNDEIELALSTQIFNDRVTINGNIGNNTNPNGVNNSEIVGDFDVIIKLTPNGKLQLKAYNRSNNNLIYETAPYTQGLGFSYKEEYNTLDELWQKITALFRRSKSRTGEAALVSDPEPESAVGLLHSTSAGHQSDPARLSQY